VAVSSISGTGGLPPTLTAPPLRRGRREPLQIRGRLRLWDFKGQQVGFEGKRHGEMGSSSPGLTEGRVKNPQIGTIPPSAREEQPAASGVEPVSYGDGVIRKARVGLQGKRRGGFAYRRAVRPRPVAREYDASQGTEGVSAVVEDMLLSSGAIS